ncbi:MAG: hypothetical protein ACK2T5_18165 [Anaerolineales bacterium]
MERFNQFLDRISDYLAHRKGLLPSLGILLIILNWILQLIPGLGWLASSNSFLHLGIILAIIGFMVAWAL